MSDVKWIKITTDILNDNKMKLIDSMPEADAIFRIWVGVLSLAGQSNSQGMIYLSENMPYTDEMLATLFNRPVNTVRLAMQTLQQFGMIEIFENGIILITNWEKHQSLDKLEKIKEQTRLRVEKHRSKLKQKILGHNPVCVYCGDPATGVDHVIPTSYGGEDVDENKVHCCIDCNRIKNSHPLEHFLNKLSNCLKHDAIRENEVLKKHIKWDENSNTYVTLRNATDKNRLDESREEKNKDSVYTDQFEQFWKAYPRTKSMNKRLALKAYNKTIKKISSDDLLKATKAYAVFATKEGIIFKYPATFLSDKDEHWRPFLEDQQQEEVESNMEQAEKDKSFNDFISTQYQKRG